MAQITKQNYTRPSTFDIAKLANNDELVQIIEHNKYFFNREEKEMKPLRDEFLDDTQIVDVHHYSKVSFPRPGYMEIKHIYKEHPYFKYSKYENDLIYWIVRGHNDFREKCYEEAQSYLKTLRESLTDHTKPIVYAKNPPLMNDDEIIFARVLANLATRSGIRWTERLIKTDLPEDCIKGMVDKVMDTILLTPHKDRITYLKRCITDYFYQDLLRKLQPFLGYSASYDFIKRHRVRRKK